MLILPKKKYGACFSMVPDVAFDSLVRSMAFSFSFGKDFAHPKGVLGFEEISLI
jgi:hypothetical protein